jgi:hypothetical protein
VCIVYNGSTGYHVNKVYKEIPVHMSTLFAYMYRRLYCYMHCIIQRLAYAVSKLITLALHWLLYAFVHIIINVVRWEKIKSMIAYIYIYIYIYIY